MPFNHSLQAMITQSCQTALELAYPDHLHFTAEVTQSTQDQFGHYQCNSAMRLAKDLKKNPREVAAALIANLPKEDAQGKAWLAKAEVAGPGFINLTLDPDYLSTWVDALYRDERLGVPPLKQPMRVVCEFSSPNTAKEMHVGHLRSTIIGECLARVLEFLGYDVLRLNHIGDWGTAFGMLITYMQDEVPDVFAGTRLATLSELVAWYKAAKVRFDADEDFKQRARLGVVALQGGDPAALKAWETICAISRKSYQEIYDLLEVTLVERGESSYNPVLPKIVAELEEKGLVTVSDGAKCVYLGEFQNREGEDLPLMVQKQDGGYLYATTDLAAIRQRIEGDKANWLIYITDAGQSTHFAMVFRTAEKAGWLDRDKIRIDHVPFGLVLGADGKKFQTRSGETVRLMDLLDKAVETADVALAERSPDMDAAERHITAKLLGLGAVKYADLSCHRLKDYAFSFERMLRFDGNTAAFIMYSYVRVNGIKRKVGVDPVKVASHSAIRLGHPSEVALGLHLSRFAETLDSLTRELLPNRLTEYLFGLAERFNAFFRDCRVEGSEEESSRLLLCEATAKVLRQGLELLGITPPERM